MCRHESSHASRADRGRQMAQKFYVARWLVEMLLLMLANWTIYSTASLTLLFLRSASELCSCTVWSHILLLQLHLSFVNYRTGWFITEMFLAMSLLSRLFLVRLYSFKTSFKTHKIKIHFQSLLLHSPSLLLNIYVVIKTPFDIFLATYQRYIRQCLLWNLQTSE